MSFSLFMYDPLNQRATEAEPQTFLLTEDGFPKSPQTVMAPFYLVGSNPDIPMDALTIQWTAEWGNIGSGVLAPTQVAKSRLSCVVYGGVGRDGEFAPISAGSLRVTVTIFHDTEMLARLTSTIEFVREVEVVEEP